MMNATTKQEKEVHSYTVKVERDLSRAFNAIARENERTGSALIREFMKEYVKKHGQGVLF